MTQKDTKIHRPIRSLLPGNLCHKITQATIEDDVVSSGLGKENQVFYKYCFSVMERSLILK